MARLDDFNAADADDLRERLRACADVPAWVDALVTGRPYALPADVRARADALAREWTTADVDRALAQHPRIGERAAGDGAEARHSADEQAGVATDDDTQRRLREGNAAYEARFDRVFLIRAAGRDAEQVLAELERRLGNDDATEAAEVAGQLREIALRRLEPLVSGAALGPNRYGKAEVRLVHVHRDGAHHTLADLNVTSQLTGDFTRDSHLLGDNALVLTTDAQKNTVHGLAREHGVDAPEAFLLALARHFTGEFAWITGGVWTAEAYGWERIDKHDHAFVRQGRETRTARVTIEDGATAVHGGLTDLTVLKSTGSEFHGFPRDRFTTLAETTDRILATAVTADWRWTTPDVDFDAAYAAVRDTLLRTFARLHSLALQQTLFAMGEAVLEHHTEVAEIRLSLPNKHHFLVDLEPHGLDNPGEVYIAADRPYGLIEVTVIRAPDRG